MLDNGFIYILSGLKS